jgi:hypothetical protein
MATAADRSADEFEVEEVIRWRSEELRRAGYTKAAALKLANQTEVDLHLAVRLLAQGCPARVALKILL